jgi:DNA-binding transcriptional LysR family regulator
VSASLARLREVFGDPLFRRTGHGVTPTPRALAMAAQVERLLGGMADLLDGERGFDPAGSDRVFRILGSDFQSAHVLPALAARLAALGSAIRIVWEPPGAAGPLADRFQRGELDLALIARVLPASVPDAQVLYEDDYVVAWRHGHPLAAADALTLDDFCAVPQVFLGYGTSVLDDLIDAELARWGRQRRAQVVVNSFAQLIDLLRRSDHVAVLGGRVAHAHRAELAWQPPPAPLALPRYRSMLCWPARAEHDAGLRWLRDTVREIALAAYSTPE